MGTGRFQGSPDRHLHGAPLAEVPASSPGRGVAQGHQRHRPRLRPALPKEHRRNQSPFPDRNSLRDGASPMPRDRVYDRGARMPLERCGVPQARLRAGFNVPLEPGSLRPWMRNDLVFRAQNFSDLRGHVVQQIRFLPWILLRALLTPNDESSFSRGNIQASLKYLY